MTEYAKAIKEMVNLKGMEAANTANHLALEKGLITLEQFRQGAQVLAKMVLER